MSHQKKVVQVEASMGDEQLSGDWESRAPAHYNALIADVRRSLGITVAAAPPSLRLLNWGVVPKS